MVANVGLFSFLNQTCIRDIFNQSIFVRCCISAALSTYFSRLKSFKFACNESDYQINTMLVSITRVMGPGDRRIRTLHNVHKDLIMFGVNWSRHCMNMGQKNYFS